MPFRPTGRFQQIWLALALALLAMFSSARATETLTFIHTDIAGSPWAATDSSGKLIWREAYRPYGERTKNRPAAETNRNFFHGKAFDSDTGLTYFGARFYDAAVGRFMGADPQGFDAANLHSFNRYAYANNNPYKFRDPDGQAPTLLDIFLTAFSAGEFVAVGGLNVYGRLSGDPGLVQATGAEMSSVTVGLIQDAAGLVNPVPGASGARRMVNAADHAGGVTKRLPDSALVCRGGSCTAERFIEGTGVTIDPRGNLQGVSVNSAPGRSVQELTKTMEHSKAGVTTVGAIRQAGGDVFPKGNDRNKYHCTMCGISPGKAQELFTPTMRNPNR